MCRNIKPLFNFDPPATPEEITNASIQFVRKLSGFQKPSTTNEEAFNQAVHEISLSVSKLLNTLQTNATPKNREEEAAKAKAKNLKRFSTSM